MGVDLTLHVVAGGKPHFYAPSRLDLAKDYELLDRLDLAPKSLVAGEMGEVWAFSGDEYKPLPPSDNYGNPTQFSTAGELCQAANGFHHVADRNRAAFAYLRELPSLTPIILDFH